MNYDPAGRTTSVVDSVLGTVSYLYDAASNRTRVTWAGTPTYYVSYEYDALNRMTAVRENGTTLFASYGYDTLSRRTSLSLGNGAGAGYQYEADDDLSQISHSWSGGGTLAYGFTHNRAHQITSQSISDTSYLYKPGAAITHSYSPDRLNRYTSAHGAAIGYDTNGNLTGDGVYSFVYDEENRLRSATGAGNTVSYEYDGLGRRRQKTVNGLTTRYLLDGDEEIGEYSGTNALQVRYIYGPAIDDRVAMVTAAGVKSWYHANHQLSTVMLTNASGNVAGSYKYLPFGESPALSTGNPYGYTGRRYDAETGLYYYRARYYSTTLGRFLQTDPVGYEDDINLYAYVTNDPLNRSDPSGKAGESSCGGKPDCQMHGTPQKTGTPGHDKASEKIGQQMKDSGQYKSVHYNQKMSTVTGDPTAGGQQPDVAGVRHSGEVDTVEVTSKSQTKAQMDQKGATMQSKLPEQVKGTHQSVSVEQGLTKGIKPSGGAVVKGAGAIGAASGLIGAGIEMYKNPNMSTLEFMYRAAGMYEVAVEAGVLPPPPDPNDSI